MRLPVYTERDNGTRTMGAERPEVLVVQKINTKDFGPKLVKTLNIDALLVDTLNSGLSSLRREIIFLLQLSRYTALS